MLVRSPGCAALSSRSTPTYIEKRRTTALQVQELRKEWDRFEESLTLEQLFGPLYPLPLPMLPHRVRSPFRTVSWVPCSKRTRRRRRVTLLHVSKRVHADAEMEKKMDSGVRVNKALAAAYGVVHKA